MVINPPNPKQLIGRLQSAPLVLYGMGGAGLRIAEWCDENSIAYIFADKAAAKKQAETGKTVLPPEKLNERYPNANIVIASIIYHEEIEGELIKLGVGRERILPYTLFMPSEIAWADLDDNIDWDLMRFRVKMFSEWITEDIKSVADYGAGRMFLQEYLAPGVEYFPVDYIRRNEQTILCDLNSGSFPMLKTDAAICSGVLEFIHTAEQLLLHVAKNTGKLIILSYLTVDKFPDIGGRRASAYVSDFSGREIVDIMARGGFTLLKNVPDPVNSACNVYMFRRSEAE